MSGFHDLKLDPAVLTALDELGFTEPTPIQEQAIPIVLEGRDVVGQAQTGTGKTAAFGLPLMQYVDPDSDELQAVVLTPTRELCIQVTQALRSFAEHVDVEVVAVFGGAPIASQQAQLRAGAQIVVATVGRMMDLMQRRSLVLTSVRYLVLDEADEMLDLGFIEDVEKILSRCPQGRQTLLFSATMPPPIRKLADRYMLWPEEVRIEPEQMTVEKIQQAFVEVAQKDKTARLSAVLGDENPEQAIIFCRTKIATAQLDRRLSEMGFDCKALHGDMSQGQRDGVMLAFKNQRLRLLVATDVAARGLDIDHVTHVINFDLPQNTESYVHRIGRTGRVGRTGRAVTFVTPAQLPDIRKIERESRAIIEEWEPAAERLEHAPARRRRGRDRASGSNGADRDAPGDDAATSEDRADPKIAAPDATEEKHTKSRRGTDDADSPVDEPDGTPSGMAKLFINRGSRSDITEDDLRWALTEGALLDTEKISDVRVLERFSFVEVASADADRVLEYLDGTKLNGHELRLEHARS
ncbi:MAG: DEAD/DEAH box helicase [Solirubrobacterales bacterium]